MDQQQSRGRGRGGRGRSKPPQSQQQGQGRGGPPGGRPAWGPQAGPSQPSAWGPRPGGGGGPQQQPSAWGPPRGGQQQQQSQGPSVPLAGRATTRKPMGGDGPGMSGEGYHAERRTVGSISGGGDSDNMTKNISRGAARSGRKIEYQNLIRCREEGQSKKGKTGREIRLQANYLYLHTTGQQYKLNQFRVDFKPDVDLTPLKKQYFKTAMKDVLKGYIFDGSVMYTPCELPHDPMEKFVSGVNEGERIQVITRRVGDVMQTDYHYLQVFNLIMRKCISNLKLKMISRNYFDPEVKVSIHDYKMELWPGYLTSIRQHEANILMCVEITHKVMRTDTVLNILHDCTKNNRMRYKEDFNNKIIGCVVMTPYNNRFYRIDDVDWNSSPSKTFSKQDGSKTTYMQYYKEKYQTVIRTTDQPMLVNRARKREIRAGAPEMIYLVPELCRMTGLTDGDRSNVALMKALSDRTRIGPAERINKLLDFNMRLRKSKEALEELKQWDMNLSQNLVELKGRILPAEKLKCGPGPNDYYTVDSGADWTRNVRSTRMAMNGSLDCIVILYPLKFKHNTQNFIRNLLKAAHGMKMKMAEPQMVEIADDRPQPYLQMLQQIIQRQDPSLVICVATNNKTDRYNAIKKKCTVEHAIPSQVILAKNLDSKGALSIATKVAIQMNCKVGGAPWGLNIPSSSTMIVGYDACHDPKDKSKSYGAMVASLHKHCTQYFSYVSRHSVGEELSNDLGLSLARACVEYKKINGSYPERIVLYRDGVGDGQLNYVIEHELKAIKDRLTATCYKTQELKLAFIIVSKRINTRIFYERGNPLPGTVVDDVITLPERYDFFIVSQCVRNGTVSPTSYNIIYDRTGFSADQFHQLSYKLCHGYFNWSGTVRVPAPCQYAHKLAFLVSQSLHRDPNPDLQNVLYYL